MTTTPDNSVPDLSPVPVYQLDEAPRLAREMVYESRDRVVHPALKVLGISEAEVQTALELDTEVENRVEGAFPNLTALVEQRIRSYHAELKDPILLEQRSKHYAELQEGRRQREAAQRNAALMRVLAPIGGGVAVLGAGLAAFFNIARPEILRVLAQREINEVATEAHTNRVLATTTPSAVGLKGVPVRFPCVKNKNDDGEYFWKPGDVRDVYSDDDLASYSYRYKVQFEKGVDPDLSVAEAGWGTTVQFIPEQLQANYPAAYGAIPVDANGSPVYMISTGKFVADPENILPSEYITGEHAEDGSLVHYVLVTSEGAACAGPAEESDVKVKMVDAILDTEYPELGIANLAGTRPEVDGAYTEQFKQYGLDTWYSRTFYPTLVDSMDVAVKEASRQGVSRAQLEVMSDFLANRKFEKDLLTLLAYLKGNVKKDTFEQFVEQLKASNAPHFSLSVDEATETSATHGYEPRKDGARQGSVTLYPSDVNEVAIFDGLIRSISSAAPVPGPLAFLTGDPMEARAEDMVFDQGIGYFLTTKAVGDEGASALNQPSEQLIALMVEKDKLDDVIRYWTFNPNDKLSANETALFQELHVTVPASPRQADIYDAVMELSLLDKPVAEVTEAERTSFSAFVTANDQIAAGTLGLESGAQSMLTALTDLSQ